MAEQEPTERLADVIPLHGARRVERIGGIPLRLGRMSLDELWNARGYAVNRLEDARTDVMILDDHIAERMLDEGPEPA